MHGEMNTRGLCPLPPRGTRPPPLPVTSGGRPTPRRGRTRRGTAACASPTNSKSAFAMVHAKLVQNTLAGKLIWGSGERGAPVVVLVDLLELAPQVVEVLQEVQQLWSERRAVLGSAEICSGAHERNAVEHTRKGSENTTRKGSEKNTRKGSDKCSHLLELPPRHKAVPVPVGRLVRPHLQTNHPPRARQPRKRNAKVSEDTECTAYHRRFVVEAGVELDHRLFRPEVIRAIMREDCLCLLHGPWAHSPCRSRPATARRSRSRPAKRPAMLP